MAEWRGRVGGVHIDHGSGQLEAGKRGDELPSPGRTNNVHEQLWVFRERRDAGNVFEVLQGLRADTSEELFRQGR